MTDSRSNGAAYMHTLERLNPDPNEERSFDNFLIGALFELVQPARFLDALDTAARCVEAQRARRCERPQLDLSMVPS